MDNETLERVKGMQLSEVLKGVKVGKENLRKLIDAEAQLDNPDGLIFLLACRHLSEGVSLRSLAKELNVNPMFFNELFGRLSLPKLTRIEALRKKWQDQDFRARQAEAARHVWQDPEFRAKNAEIIQQLWRDPDFRIKQADAARRMFEARWQDPDFKSKKADASRQMWQNQEFREKIAEAVRRARMNPDNLSRYKLPTIYGYRKDVGFAQSAWEANLARVLSLIGRDYQSHQVFELDISDSYQDFFNDTRTSLDIDFLTVDKRGRVVGYEIMAHPLEDPASWVKLELVGSQFPRITFKVVSSKFYRRLAMRFSKRINEDPRFAGWENQQDNLKNNPQKYS